MSNAIFAVLLVFVGDSKAIPEPGHQQNAVYADLMRADLKLGGAEASLPPPILHDGMSANEQKAAILKVAGSEELRDQLLRDSVTAPFILRSHDSSTGDAIFRHVDLWFVVRGDLDKLEPNHLVGEASGRKVEVGNMQFETRRLNPGEIRNKELLERDGREISNWFVLVKGRLLGRIGFEVADEAAASRAEESMVVASRASSAFSEDGSSSNRWWTISKDGKTGPDQPFAGGLCYAKVSRLKAPEGALLVEIHSIFSEPRGWFHGEPILRSKFSLIAQDQIRKLRRELAPTRSRTSP